jgi:hypothetical protein
MYLSLNCLYVAKSSRHPTPRSTASTPRNPQSTTSEPRSTHPTIQIEVTPDRLSTLLTSYTYRMHAILPIVDTAQVSRVILGLGDGLSIPKTIASAIALPILAYGALDDPICNWPRPESRLGTTCHAQAVDTLRHMVKHNLWLDTLEYVQAMLLAVAYGMQLGNLLGSYTWITTASNVFPRS